MALKQFAVVVLPHPDNLNEIEPEFFDEFHDAFTALTEDTDGSLRQPKKAEPMRIEVDGYVRELWIVERKEPELVGSTFL
ncbi:hypothetical protein ACFOWM_06100 [Ferruginibacter yonginensis]|uniref:Uncharacterized protein n=1 Tax=Ferruginibacter yonginensis TaxID=1310416 RepID=A0ABV8QSU0_9BACT